MNNITVRMVLYVLSPLLAMLAPLLANYGVGFDAETLVLSVHLPTLIGAVVAAFGISGAIFAKWGVR